MATRPPPATERDDPREQRALEAFGFERTPMGSLYDPEARKVLDPAPALERDVTSFGEDVASLTSQFTEGLGESGTSGLIGISELVGADRAQDFWRERQGVMDRAYGGEGTGAGTAGKVAGRLTGEVAQFAAPGRALGSFAARVAGRLPQASRIGQAAARVAKPSSRAARVARETVTGGPPQAAIAASGPEESMLGLAAEMTGSETLETAARNPWARALGEVAADVGTMGAVEGLGAFGRMVRRKASPLEGFDPDLGDVRPRDAGPSALERGGRSTPPPEGGRLPPGQRERLGRVGAGSLERELESAADVVERVRGASQDATRAARTPSSRLTGPPERTRGEVLPSAEDVGRERARQLEPDLPTAREAGLGRAERLSDPEAGGIRHGLAASLAGGASGAATGAVLDDEPGEGALKGGLLGMGITEGGQRAVRRMMDGDASAAQVGQNLAQETNARQAGRAAGRAGRGGLRGSPPDVEPVQASDVGEAGEDGGLFRVAAEKGREMAEKGRDALRRQFTVVGDLPEEVAERELKMNNRIQSELKEATFLQRDFDRALREAGYAKGFRGLSEDQLRRFDGALKGEVDLDQFAEPVAREIKRMRDHIDRLSRRMIEEGIVEGPLAATVNANLGTYAKRSYRIFDDPDEWANKVPEKVRNRAKAWFRQEIRALYPELSDEAVEKRARGEIEKILHNKADSPLAFFASGKLGSKDLGILQRRKDVPEPIRRLMGEYEDPVVNYVRSVHDMADLLEKQAFLDDVRKMGKAEGWLSEDPVGEVAHPIAAEGSSVMEPLNGLHTTREIKRAFEEHNQVLEEVSGVTRWLLMKPIALTKMGKTVLSPMTHVRNFESNVLPQIASGHNPLRHWSKGARAVRSQLPSMERLSTRLGADPEAAREYLLELKELGVVDQSARAGEMRDVLQDAFGRMEEGASELTRGRLRGASEGATKMYQAEDDFWKAVFYESERDLYREALPDMAEDELKELAARRTRQLMPTYDRVSKAVKRLRRFPFMSSFPSFYAEVIRNSGNLLKITARELASDNPAVRKIGRRRAMGILSAAAIAPVVSAGSRFLMGAGAYAAGKAAVEGLQSEDEGSGLKGAISADQDQDIRRFLPPWSKNSTIVYTGRDDEGRLNWVDLSYTDYYAGLRKPVTAMMRGEDWGEKFGGAIGEALDPFASEDIFVQKILNIARNKTKTGGEVWNPQDDATGKVEDALGHMWEALEPGGVTSAKRIVRGLQGKVRPWGQAYDAKREAAAVAAGVRFQQLDVPQALSFKVRDHREATRDAQRILTRTASNRGEVSEDDLRDAYREMEKSRRKVWGEAHEDAQAALRLGVPEQQVYQLLDQSFSKRDARAILQGTYIPYRPSSRFFQSLVENVRSTGDQDDVLGMATKVAERRRLILEEANRRKPEILGDETRSSDTGTGIGERGESPSLNGRGLSDRERRARELLLGDEP